MLELSGLTQATFGLLVLGILILRPSGITGGGEISLSRLWSRGGRGTELGDAGAATSAPPTRAEP